VIQGLDVLDRIASVPCTGSGNERSQPVERIAVTSIRVVPAA
jgi:cyclophilin family peptidyl-prolyl cis-trans isomerase